MMATSVVSRRRFLVAAAGAGLLSPGIGFAQTLIENSPSSGPGWTPPSWPYGREQLVSTPPEAPPRPRVVASPSAAQSKDWRQYLLAGERSIFMGRDGPARRIRYCTEDGLLDSDGYGAACSLLRDVHANKLVMMDPRLLDVLCGIQRWMEYNGRRSTIEILSGFRTQQTNASLEGAAKNSMHLYGKAADIFISGASSAQVGAMVQQFNSNGGTGVYLARGFVHVDTGAARTWVSSAPRRRG